MKAQFFIVILIFSTLAACTDSRTLDKTATSPEFAQDITMESVHQLYREVNCAMESRYVWKQEKRAEIKLRIDPPYSSDDLVSSYFMNETTGSAPCDNDLTSFKADFGVSSCNMKLKEGLNAIRYSFSYCRYHNDDDSKCYNPYTGEQGLLYINVIHIDTRKSDAITVIKCPYPY